MDGATGSNILAGVGRHAAGRHLTGAFAVEEITDIDAIDLESVIRITLPVGPDRLVPEPLIGASAVDQLRVDAGRQNGELCEAACC